VCLGESVRTVHLLVVEDSPSYLYLIKAAFEEHAGAVHWELAIATDGQQALDFLFAEERENDPLPALILLDWNLPKVNGREVLQRIKDHQKLRRIPVLVFSSSQAERDIRDAYDGRANGYITKPDSGKVMEGIVGAIEQFWVAVAQLPKVAR
jgi:two-component system, chemotaxis family, response regulator Rcp1